MKQILSVFLLTYFCYVLLFIVLTASYQATSIECIPLSPQRDTSDNPAVYRRCPMNMRDFDPPDGKSTSIEENDEFPK